MKFPTPELETAWLDALDSGKFAQAQSALASHTYDGRYAYCCMGVAGVVLGLSSEPMTERGHLPGEFSSKRSDTSIEMEALGIETPFTERERYALATLNDMHGLTFRQIAAFVRGADETTWESIL